jgi:hypothetical protein
MQIPYKLVPVIIGQIIALYLAIACLMMLDFCRA